MPILHRDIETRSTIDLTEVGGWRYAAEPNTGVWCVAYAVDDAPVQTWIPGQPVPEEFFEAARNPDWIVVAHNDAFERVIEEHILAPRYGWPIVPIERHRCTMAMALASALPGALSKVGEVLELSRRKDDQGARLMKQMAQPRKPCAASRVCVNAHDRCDGGASAPCPYCEPKETGILWHDDPEKLERLYAYCRNDVEAERELFHRLPPLAGSEQALWVLDALINQRGFHTDGPLLEAASRIGAAAGAAAHDEIARITDGALTSTNQVEALQAWLSEIQKPTLKHALTRKGLDPVVRRVIELRLGTAHAAAAKIDTLIAWRNTDGRVRGTLRFHGAGTGRWTGHGPQPQNFKRDGENIGAKREAIATGDLAHVQKLYAQPLEVVGDIARAMICAAPGHRFLVGDFSGVESRVLAWVSGQQSKLDQWAKFDRSGDPKDEPYYLLGRSCGQPEESARTIGKTADLAFGFMGGPGAWDKLAPDDDATSHADKRRYQQTWRRMHPRTEQFWRGIDRLAIAATKQPNSTLTYKRFTLTYDGTFLRIVLPSGRALSYPFPRLETGKYGHPMVMFKDNTGGKFVDCRYGQGAYGGLWTENIVQAVSRDLLAGAMLRLEAAGYPIVLTVHDEIVCEAPIGFGSVEDFQRIITTLPDWAEGLSIAAKVRNGERFSKSTATKTIEEFRAPTSTSQPDAAAMPDQIDEKANSMDQQTPPWIDEEIEPRVAHVSKPTDLAPVVQIPVSIVPEETCSESEAPKIQTDPELGPYIYQNARGDRHAKVSRTPNGKSRFTQQQWDGKAWIAGTPKHKLPYRLPELLAADPEAWVCITEGEKDALNVAKLGLVATTNPNGAKGWNSAKLVPYFAHLRRIAILEDNDAAGRERTKRIIKTLRVLDPAPDIRVVSFPELADKGDVSDWLKQDQGRGRAELLARIEAISTGDELGEWDAGSLLDQGLPPPREWIYGRQLCRCFASSLVAPGDIGKTTMRLIQAVELATGRELLGHRIYQRCRVLVVCLEDDRNELHRRLLAICKHHQVDPADLKGWLFCADINGPKLVEAVDGVRLLGALEPMLRKAIELRRPGVVILDPFVKLHALDENNNPDMDFVCSQLVNLAKKYNIAIDSPAHTRKGALIAGDSDNRRGASAQRDAGRLDYTLTAMTEEEAKRFGIEQDERKSYVRLDRAKANIVRAIGASWYHLVSVTLGNVTELYPEGDEVQTLEVWTPPDVWLDLDAERVNRILDKIDAGLSDGDRYSPTPSAKKPAAWPLVVEEVPDKAEAQAREVIKSWLKGGILISRKYESPTERKPREGLFVDPVKRPKP
jgi:DNA polymerase bacteriophage-type